MIFQQNAKGLTKGERIVVSPELPQDVLDQAARYAIYRPSTLTLAQGDKLRISAGGNSKDGRHRLNNGAVFDVKAVQENGDIELTNGWTIDAKFGHVTQGFISTSHSAQGKTVQDVFISESAESFSAASQEQFYVSASRGRNSARIYTNSKEELREAIQSSSANTTASELFWPPKEPELHRKQQLAATTELDHEIDKKKELAYVR